MNPFNDPHVCGVCARPMLMNHLWKRIPTDIRRDLLGDGWREAKRHNLCKACYRRTPTGDCPDQFTSDFMVAMWEEHRRSWDSYNETYRRIAEDIGCSPTRVAKAIQRQRKAGLL